MADTHIFVICFGSKCYYLIGGWRLQQIRNKEGLERLCGTTEATSLFIITSFIDLLK